MRHRSAWLSNAALLFTVTVWGLNFPIVKAALAVMHPHVLNVFRFIVSATALGITYRYFQRKSGRGFFEPLRKHGRQIAMLGLFGFVVYQFSFIEGIDHTTPGNAALIMATAPMWTAVVGYLRRTERLAWAAWVGLLASLAGAVVVVLGGAEHIAFTSDTFAGNVIMFGAAIFWGSYTALSKPLLRHVQASALTFLGLLFALPFLFGIAIPYFGQTEWSRVDAWVWLAILFSGGLSTGITVVIWNRAIHLSGASHTAVFGNLVPLIALLSSTFIVDEPITGVQLVGGTLIVGGVVWMRRWGRRTRAEETSATQPAAREEIHTP